MCFWKIIGIEHQYITGEYISEQITTTSQEVTRNGGEKNLNSGLL